MNQQEIKTWAEALAYPTPLYGPVAPGADETAYYLEVIVGHGLADESEGDSSVGLAADRVGDWILYTDDQGFRDARQYADEGAASRKLERFAHSFN